MSDLVQKLKEENDQAAQRVKANLAAIDAATDAVQESIGGCREELGAPYYDKCWEPAEYVLWGKLMPKEALGPRCYDHAAKHLGHQALREDTDYALIHVGNLARAVVDATGGAPERKLHGEEA